MKIFIIVLTLFPCVNLYSEDFKSEKEFIQAFLNSSPKINSHFHESFNSTSNRFGISYHNTPHKVLADKLTPIELLSQLSIDDFNYENLGDGYSVSKLIRNSMNLEFFFLEGKYIPDIFFKIKDYISVDTRFLRIFTNKDVILNDVAKTKLDEFILTFAHDFKMNESLKEVESEKIFYVYTESIEEIERLIGVQSRGIYLISSDIIVSNYPCHFHELCHFLINLKLKDNLKPAHPLFLEGLAVAFGGRGGISRFVETGIGKYIINSGFVNVNEFLSYDEFYKHDLSISYSVAGYLVRSLYEKNGSEKLLDDYQYYSAELSDIKKLLVDENIFDLSYNPEELILIESEFKMNPQIEIENLKIEHLNDLYLISTTADNILIKDDSYNPKSKIFSEKFPNVVYNSERYLIECEESSIKVYDLFTEELLYMLSTGFMSDPVSLSSNGEYNFILKAKLFDEDFSNYNFYLKNK